MSKRRVVITGLGIVSPIGNDVATAWGNVVAGNSGIGAITHFDASTFPTRIAGEVHGFDPTHYIPAKDVKKMDTFIQYGVAASIDALKDAGLQPHEHDAERIGVAVGAGIGGIAMIERTSVIFHEGGQRKISPFFVPGSIINMAAGNLSIMLGLKGPNIACVTACTTATHNLGLAMRTIQYGYADVMIAGGAEYSTTGVAMGGFCSARAMSTRNDEPHKASRPWDRDRDGFVLSEGAGILVLEEYEHAMKRGARIYCELAGFVMSADAHHITSPSENGDGAARCMAAAMKDAGLNADQVQYINAHGTSDPGWRPRRDRGGQALLRRSCKKTDGQFDQVDDRASARCGGWRRGNFLRAGHARRHRSADDQSGQSRRRLRSGFRPAHRASTRRGHCAVELVRFRRHQRHAGVPASLSPAQSIRISRSMIGAIR